IARRGALASAVGEPPPCCLHPLHPLHPLRPLRPLRPLWCVSGFFRAPVAPLSIGAPAHECPLRRGEGPGVRFPEGSTFLPTDAPFPVQRPHLCYSSPILFCQLQAGWC